MARDTAEDAFYRGLLRARAEGDSAYLIDVLRMHPEHASLAAGWLADWGETEAIPQLTRLLGSAKVETRRAAAHALADLGPTPEARPVLEAMARHDPDAAARAWAYSALGSYGDPGLLPVLIVALRDEDWRIRNGAAVALGELGDGRALAPLRATLKTLRRSPLSWYLGRTAVKKAIKAVSET